MNRRADRVMCVYASGNKVDAFRVKAKNARGRPRPPAREERSTSPFPSRAVRCLSVAIFEIASPVARSPRDTLPCRLSVRRICFFADEKPASRPPTSTGSGFGTRPMKAERYNIHFDLQKWMDAGNGTDTHEAKTQRRAVNPERGSSRDRRRGPAKLLGIDSVRTWDEDTDPRSDRPEGLGNRGRRGGDRRERRRESVRTHEGPGVKRRVAARRG